MLLFMAAIPLGALAYAAIERRRRRRAVAYGIPIGRSDVAAGRTALRRRVAAAYTTAGLAILVLALARPEAVVSLPRVEGTVILSFDVSGSMAATDVTPDDASAGPSDGPAVEATDRMAVAKAAARAFVDGRPPSVRIGVVAFSDGAFSTQVPTVDEAQVTAAIDRLTPERGTSLGRGILTSLTAIEAADGGGPAVEYYTSRSPEPTPSPTPLPDGTHAPAAIVLFSDGENNQAPEPIEAAQAAADRGVRIYTVGVGSPDGATLEVDGFLVHSRLDEALLRAVAETTGGSYLTGADFAGLALVYDEIRTQLVVRPESMEVTSLLAGLGIAVLLIGGVASLAWFGRLP
jgi:Ca-activated chloride channel family protein